jgi:type VI protein secretion system component VasF
VAAGDDGPQGSHKICKDAPREVANALISAWTPLLLMASNSAVVLDAAETRNHIIII